MKEPKTSTSYFAAIDGMRAIAILSILVFHTGLYHNGLFGVDLFFVLSGFLITLTLLRESHERGSISLARFYLRRAKRLLPLLLITLAFALWFVIEWGSPAELSRFSKQAAASLVYLTNWEQISAGQNYWDGFSTINPLGHMWSLAITEQFYLLWPLLLLLVVVVARSIVSRSGGSEQQRARITSILVLIVSLFGVVLASSMSAIRFDGSNADRLYLGTDTHFVGLVAGAAAAALCHLNLLRANESAPSPSPMQPSKTLTALSSLALIAIIVCSILASSYEAPWLYQYGFALVSVLGALFAFTLTSEQNLLACAFSVRPLVELGKVSYTLFLVHLPIFWLIQRAVPHTNDWSLLLVGVPVSIVVASALHHVVAEPLRLRRWGKKGVTVAASAVAAVGVAVLLIPTVILSVPAAAGSGEIRVLTLGDSLANDFATALSADSADAFTVFDGGLAGCGVSGGVAQRTYSGYQQNSPKTCNPWQVRWAAEIEKAQPDVIVVNTAWDAVSQKIDGEWTDLTSPNFATTYRASLQELADLTRRKGVSVLIANSRPFGGAATPQQAAAFNEVIAEVVKENEHLKLLDLKGEMCSSSGCPTRTASGEERYLDDRVHFSEAGKSELAPWLTSEIFTSAQRRY